MSNTNDMIAQLAEMLGLNYEPVDITRAEFSAEGRSFIVYTTEGEAYGGDLNDTDSSVDEVKENLLKDITSGALGQHFAMYQPVPADILAQKRGENTDWADIYNA